MSKAARSCITVWFLFSLASCDGSPAPSDAGVDAGVDAEVPDPALSLPARGGIAAVRHPDGRLDIADDRGTVYLRNARAEALVREEDAERIVRTDEGCAGDWRALDAAWNEAPYFAEGEGWEWSCTADGDLDLHWAVWIDAAHDTLLTRVSVGSGESSPERTVLRLTSLISDGDDGGLFVGGDVHRHRILDSGADVVRETEAFLRYPEERALPIASALPIHARGTLIANWNHAISDLDGHRHWIAGTLGVETGFPAFGVSLRGDGPLDETTGRRGLSSFAADSLLLFDGKPLHPGGRVTSESVYVDPLSEDPLDGLERYADAVAAALGVELWTERDGGRAVPTGWNSWSGSGSTGGLGTDIDQTIMRECLEVMARELAPFGVDYFQVDDGYQNNTGDWLSHPTRFPDGVEDLSARIEAEGLIPGLWIEAFLAEDESALATDHPAWLRDPADVILPGVLMPDSGERALDVSNPDALAWLAELMRRYRDDWGVGWVKLDFSYLAFPYVPLSNPELSSVEAFRDALATVGDALGRDVFYLGIGLIGMSYGIVDGMRLTLDDGPVWEEPSPLGIIGQAGNLKSTVRTGSRRYFLHGRVWLTHNDLLFFRTAPDEPPLTLEEATTFASFIGLTGSIVKIGEDLRTLTPAQIDVLRRLLPIYPATGRPLDLFVRNYPEVWHLPIEGTLAGSDARWSVLGLLHWGRNFDFAIDGAPIEMADEPRAYRIPLTDLGLDGEVDHVAFEFWSETYLGTVTGAIERTVPPHGHEVIALREALAHPQLIGTNRHFTQGATDLVSESWDEGARALTLRFTVDAGASDSLPFEYRVYVRAPTGFALDAASSSGATAIQEGEVVRLAFTPDAPGERELVVRFGP